MNGGPKDLVWRNDVPFGCPKFCNYLLVVQNLQKLGTEWKSQQKQKRAKMLNNFVITQITPIAVTNH
jgi:hypothetical protein